MTSVTSNSTNSIIGNLSQRRTDGALSFNCCRFLYFPIVNQFNVNSVVEETSTTTTKMEEHVQQYNLKWTNYVNNILQGFIEHLSTESLTDVTFSCEGQLIKAHKMVLSACSVYFQQIFQIDSTPNPLIIMHGVRFNDLRQIIQFMYQGEIKVAEHDMEPVLALAESLRVKGLCSVRTNNVPDSAVPDEKPTETLSKRRRYSQSSISETVTSEESALTEDPENLVKPESPVISPSCVPLNMSTNSVPSSQCAESFNYNNASIIDELNAFKRLNEKLAALPQDIPITTNLPRPPLEAHIPERLPNNKGGIPVKIPRPPNAFMVFANEWRKKVAKKHPGENNKEISVRLGNIWKTLPMNSKIMYYNTAKAAEKEHKAKYPGYTYSPKEARKRKEVKLGTKKSNEDQYIIKIIPHENVHSEDLLSSNKLMINDDEVQFVQNIKEEIEEEEEIAVRGEHKSSESQ